MRSTLTPGPSSISYCVTVGPRENPVTRASTWNWSSTLGDLRAISVVVGLRSRLVRAARGESSDATEGGRGARGVGAPAAGAIGPDARHPGQSSSGSSPCRRAARSRRAAKDSLAAAAACTSASTSVRVLLEERRRGHDRRDHLIESALQRAGRQQLGQILRARAAVIGSFSRPVLLRRHHGSEAESPPRHRPVRHPSPPLARAAPASNIQLYR